MKIILRNPKDNALIECECAESSIVKDLIYFVTKHYNALYEVRFIYAGKVIEYETSVNSFDYKEGNPIFIVLGKKIEETVSESEFGYEKTYSGKEVLSACQNNGNVMFNVITDLACRNPYFLSYLAVDATKAKSYLYDTLCAEDFELKIKGETVQDDPIALSNMHVSGENGYDIDERNLKFILMLSEVEGIDYDEAKDYYLYYDRDILRTLTKLKNL